MPSLIRPSCTPTSIGEGALAFLPRAVSAAGAWYLLTGLACIALADSRALSPWAMGIPYGAGQLLVAAILLFTAREGSDES